MISRIILDKSAHTVEITEIYSHSFLTKISWKRRIYEWNYYYLVDLTKKIWVRVNFSFSHTVLNCRLLLKNSFHWKIFREINWARIHLIILLSSWFHGIFVKRFKITNMHNNGVYGTLVSLHLRIISWNQFYSKFTLS